MKKKKNSFLAFISSLIPGAGEMYVGFMNRGLSIMASFWGLILFSVWLHMDSLLFGIPIIWFYSFFETHNLRSLSEAELAALPDEYFSIFGLKSDRWKTLQRKYRNVFALVLIVIGFSILWNNMYDIFSDVLPEAIRDAFYAFGHYFPQLLIGFAIIALGIWLILGKKRELDMEDKLTLIEDKGGKL